MKDTNGMNEEKKRRYIFEDTSFESQIRFNWITDCLLGDIRTFLAGIEYFIIPNKGEPAGKRHHGGGNLSVPILINTALEFVAALYTGKTDYMKFNTDIKFEKDLKDGEKVPEDLKREFKIRNFPLPETNDITKTDIRWEIKDKKTDKTYYVVTKKGQKDLFTWEDVPGNNEKFLKFLKDELKLDWAKEGGIDTTNPNTITVSNGGKNLTFSLNEETDEVTLRDTNGCRVFISQKEKGKNNIYRAKKLIFHFHDRAKYNAATNVKKFIERFFPDAYNEIPSLLWDGIRNGLVHTFSPKPFEYNGTYIGFQFYVEDQNFPSHIEKVKAYLFDIDIDAKFETKLNEGNIPKELVNRFKTRGFPLPENFTVLSKKEEKNWEITNGVDTFYILEKEDKDKINVYYYIFQIRINVFEQFRVLEKAVEAYRAELENNDVLQDKFIRAWSSIEEYTEKADDDQEKEVNELNNCLNQRNHVFLLKDLNDQLSVDVLKIYSLNLKIRKS